MKETLTHGVENNEEKFYFIYFFCLIPFLQEAGSIIRKRKARIRTWHVQLRTITYLLL